MFSCSCSRGEGSRNRSSIPFVLLLLCCLLCWLDSTYATVQQQQQPQATQQQQGPKTNSQLSGSAPSNGPVGSQTDAQPMAPRSATAARTTAAARQQQQKQQQQKSLGALSHTTTTTTATSRRLHQYDPLYAQLPADLTGLESILAAARDAFTFFEPQLLGPHPPIGRQQQQQQQQQYMPSSRSLGGYPSRNAAAQEDVSLLITFRSAHPDAEVGLRVPGPPRSFNVTVLPMGGPGPQQPCSHTNVPYGDQELLCSGMVAGSKWQATLVDADADDLVLASANFTIGTDVSSPEIPVELGVLSVEAAFHQLAWAGMYYPRPRHSKSSIIIHAQIVGAQVTIYTRQGGTDVIWDVQWTGTEGTTTFFLLPGVRNVYYANMSVGETVLRSTPITLDETLYYQDPSNEVESVPQLQQQQLIAAPQLLCTGEVEEVRGSAGTFPQSLALADLQQQPIYHPRGFTCRWELVPDQPDVLLSVDYRGLLPDESIILELAPNNVVKLTPPEGGPGAVFQASIWVEHSILVSFQSTRASTSKVGSFSISWTSVSSGNKNILEGKMMVVVLSCVSAAGAVLAACCFYFVCCGRRRRAGGVVMDGEESPRRGGVQLVRVPSEVRNLLPSKPYQAPEANPLPGAEAEPDCCSICLVELEDGEQVTVLPCMHFYHQDCIGSWLKRNCTCPLCKNNVLEAFKVQQYEALQKVRRNRRTPRGGVASRANSPSPFVSGSSSSGGRHGSSEAAEAAGAAGAAQQQVEMTVVQPASPLMQHSGSRTSSPWPLLGAFRSPSPSPAALPGGNNGQQDEAPVVLTLSPARSGSSRLPPLLVVHTVRANSAGSNASSLVGSNQAPSSAPASTTAAPSVSAVSPLVIPPSPSPSLISMQSGTVLATPEDFAPAAAAAAALFSRPSSRQRSLSPSSMADAAANAAQASVAALRTSSRNIARRVQVLLTSPTAGAAAAAAGAGAASTDSHVQQPTSGNGSSNSSSPPAALSAAGSFGGAAGPRVAVSIYAYAGNPSGTDEETGQDIELEQVLAAAAGGAAGGAAGPHQAITLLHLPGAVLEGGASSPPPPHEHNC